MIISQVNVCSLRLKKYYCHGDLNRGPKINDRLVSALNHSAKLDLLIPSVFMLHKFQCPSYGLQIANYIHLDDTALQRRNCMISFKSLRGLYIKAKINKKVLLLKRKIWKQTKQKEGLKLVASLNKPHYQHTY